MIASGGKARQDKQIDETGQADRRDRTSKKKRQESRYTRQDKQIDETGAAERRDRTSR